MSDSQKKIVNSDIAIIGMGCRMPGNANTPDEFWYNVLSKKIDTIVPIPFSRKEWDKRKYYSDDVKPGKYYVNTGGFLKDGVVQDFDSEFFMMSSREASSLDPQHRILLEVTWEALENANIVPSSLAGSNTGVYVGIHWDDYSAERYYVQHPRNINAYSTLSNLRSLSAGRISYFLDLHGPTMQIDTACSSGLVSLISAVRGLRNYEINLAIVGGISLLLTPHMTIGFCQMGVLSRDGRSKTFSARADGFSQGEGCNVMILKRLSDAIKDRDNIIAVVRGVAINHDGRSLTITTPSSVAQQKMLKLAIDDAGVNASDIQYIETHGTGTSLGDYIEVSSLASVFSCRDNPLFLGSVKTNVGHLGATAGLAGLMKAALSIKYDVIPANLHFDVPNSRLQLKKHSFVVPTELTQWSDLKNKIAGVSAFGMSGTNAHVIISGYNNKYQQINFIERDSCEHLFAISAKSKLSLETLLKKFKLFLQGNSDLELPDVCYTLGVGRDHFTNFRFSVVSKSIKELIEKLGHYIDNSELRHVESLTGKKVFLFTGQGSQYKDMGLDLYNAYPVFREAFDNCMLLLKQNCSKYLDKSLFDALSSRKFLDITRYTQVSLFVFEYALANLWLSWGIRPDILLGHSVGEYVAACIAGIFSLKDALKLISARGHLIEKLASDIPGGMLSISSSEEYVKNNIDLYGSDVSIAAFNGPTSIVVSGKSEIISLLEQKMRQQNIECYKLVTSHAFHSNLMQPVLNEFFKVASSIKYHAPKIKLLSSVTNTFVNDGDTLDAKYWTDHIVNPVRFSKSINVISKINVKLFIEIGPKSTLISIVRSCLEYNNQYCFLSSVRPGYELSTILNSLSLCYMRGININWLGFYHDRVYRKVILPNYSFNKQKHWVDIDYNRDSSLSLKDEAHHALIQNKLSSPLGDNIQFESRISYKDLDYISDHLIFGERIFPASAYLEMILTVSKVLLSSTLSTTNFFDVGSLLLTDVSIVRALTVTDSKTLRVIVFPNKDKDQQEYYIEIYALSEDQWHKYVTAKSMFLTEDSTDTKPMVDIDFIKSKFSKKKDVVSFYQSLQSKGINYGPSLQNIKTLWTNDEGEALAHITLKSKEENHQYVSHPSLLDTCFHVLLANLPVPDENLYLPIGYKRFIFLNKLPSDLYSYVSYEKSETAEILQASLQLFDAKGSLLCTLDGCKLRKTKSVTQSKTSLNRSFSYNISWEQSELDNNKFFGNVSKGGINISSEKSLIISDSGESLKIATHLSAELAHYQADSTLLEECDNIDWHSVFNQNVYNNIICFRGFLNRDLNQDEYELLSLVQYIKNRNLNVKLFLITTNTIPFESKNISFWQGPVWGFGRTLALELDISVSCIDLDLQMSSIDNAKSILRELLSPSLETQITYRKNNRYVGRLKQYDFTMDNSAKILSLSNYGVLASLQMKSLTLRPVQAKEVRVKVVASGLNFRDLLRALGMMRNIEDPKRNKQARDLLFGYECSGVVEEVGIDVTKFKKGEEVIVYGSGNVATHVISHEDLIVTKPSVITFTQAASVPVAYITALYGIVKCAKLKSSDKILIHNAAGGVGQAAVQLSKAIGAEIYATAHPTKWEFLKSCGVRYIYSSRDFNFEKQIKLDTKGSGVNVILNSLNGEFVDRSVNVLGVKGRFVEIGKLKVWDSNKFYDKRPDAKFYMFDLSEISNDKISSLLHEITNMLREKSISALPVKSFSINQVEQAFRYIQQAKHIGKVVVSASNNDVSNVFIRGNCSYLITGGFGGLGLRILSWLVEKGAKHIIVFSRSKPNQLSRAIIESLPTDVKVSTVEGDISDYKSVQKLNSFKNIRGIVHAAGIIEDGLITKQSRESFRKVLLAKVYGTWNIHNVTKDLQLDYFICFSSIASLIGSVGQSNYASANAFMDYFAHYRHSIGLPCTSINWGPWAEVGMAAPLANRLKLQGYNLLGINHGLQILENIIRFYKLPQIVIVLMNWKVFLQRLNKEVPFLSQFTNKVSDNEILLIDTLSLASPHERLDLLEDHIKKYIKTVIGLSDDTIIDNDVSVFDLGLDSLMAVELKNIIEKNIKKKIRSTLLFDFPSVSSLLNYIPREIPDVLTMVHEEVTSVGDRISTDIGVKSDKENPSDINLQELKDLTETL